MPVTIASLLYDCNRFGKSETIYDADDLQSYHTLLIVHGGEDISPKLYGETPCHNSGPASPSKRDILEMQAIRSAWDLGIPVLGICRGAQLACVMRGGKLYQDVPFHEGQTHSLHIIDSPEKSYLTNSFHHQMMIPDPSARILATAGQSMYRAKRWRNDSYKEELIVEPEVVYWKDYLTLGVQGHPEWDYGKNGIYQYTCELLSQLFNINGYQHA